MARKMTTIRVVESYSGPLVPFRLAKGCLVEHDEYGWGLIRDRARQDILITFATCGEKIISEDLLLEHLVSIDENPRRKDPNRMACQRRAAADYPDSSQHLPGPRWSRYSFTKPNTTYWNRH